MMKKGMFFSILGLVLCFNVYAQQASLTDKDTLLYYVDHNNKISNVKDSAEYLLLIMPADTTSGEKIYPVVEYYSTMKKKVTAYSRSQKYYSLIFEGPRMEFYPNGHKKSIQYYSNGTPIGSSTFYYPNGKLYANEMIDSHGGTLFVDCQDSIGNVLAKDGNGKWIKYDDNFNNVAEGAIKDSVEDGEWTEKILGKNETTVFNMGKAVASTSKYRMLGNARDVIFSAVEQEPRFPGDFGVFLSRNIHYPAYAKEHNQQGRVFVQFVVEKDGSLSNIKVARTSGFESIDNEGLRVISISPKWQPGMQKNKPVRVMYTVPISFTYSTENN